MTEKKKGVMREDLQGDLKVIKDFIPNIVDFIKKHKKKLIIIIAIFAVIGTVATIELLHYTSEPEFCNLFCHEMGPEVDSWEKSWHAQRGVDCKACHYGAGIKGVIVAKWNAQTQLWHHITGAYANHPLEEAKEHGFELAEQNIHQKGNKIYYIKAHGYAIDVINYNCKRCHENVAEIERSSGRSVRMAHKQHGERGVECSDCHINIVHGLDPKGLNYPSMWTCFKCHNDKDAPREDCGLCHVGQKEMWEGTGAQGVPFGAPADMLGEVDCSECHLEEEDYIPPQRELCIECHDDDESYGKMLEDWQLEVKKNSNTLRNILDEVEHRIKEMEESGIEVKDFAKAKELYEKARFNASVVEQDGSEGAHNFDYAISTLYVSLKMARDSRRILTAEE
jgi:nitrate/TMAO reductase-like tetraheme cytochrome c subunit